MEIKQPFWDDDVGMFERRLLVHVEIVFLLENFRNLFQQILLLGQFANHILDVTVGRGILPVFLDAEQLEWI